MIATTDTTTTDTTTTDTQLLAAYRVLMTESLLLFAYAIGGDAAQYQSAYFDTLLARARTNGAFAAAAVDAATLAALTAELVGE